jgi:hypothetical protein
MKRYIKIFICIVGLASLTYGCTYFKEHHANAVACLADEQCKKEVQGEVNVWKSVAEGSGYPMAGVAVGVFGTYLVAFFKKKKVKPNV